MKATTDTNKQITAYYKPHFMENNFAELTISEGFTIAEIVSATEIDNSLRQQIRVYLNGQLIPHNMWPYVRPKNTAAIQIALVPMGGDILRTVAIIAVAAFAPQIAATIPGLTTAGGALTFTGKLVSAGIGLVGTLLVNSLFPPPKPQTQKTSPQESPTLSIGGQSNQAKPYGPVTRVYGTHKVFPNVVGAPFVTTVGQTQYLYGLYDFGYGDLTIQNIQIGETPIDQYDGVNYIVRKDTNFSIYTNDVNVEQIGSVLSASGDTQTRNTVASANGFEIDLTFPQGLIGFNKDGGKTSRSVDYRVQYRTVGSNTWLNATDADFFVSGKEVVVGNTSSITITPVAYTYKTASKRKYFAIGFNIPDDSIEYSYTGDDPSVGHVVYLPGRKATIKSVNTSTKKLTFNAISGGEVVLFDCGTSRVSSTTAADECPTPQPYTARTGTPNANGTFRVTHKRQDTVFASMGVRGLSDGQYEVKLTRLGTASGGNYQNSDTSTWTALKSHKDSAPVTETKEHTYLELKIKASEELSGVIQNLSAICTSVLDVWDGSAWVKQETANPAWIYADILTGNAASRPLDKSRLDTTSLLNWSNFCDEEVNVDEGARHSLNFIVDYNTTMGELLDQVCSSARATKSVTNGRYGVSIDEEKTIPVQHFTPRNSWGFSSSRTYIDKPQAVKVKFIDPDNNWQVRERIVYNDGFDATSATRFDDLDYFGCTDPDQAYRHGRYMIAQGVLRQENVSISVDMENLVCTRGDLVSYTSDVMIIGGQACRIVSISGNQVTIDELFAPPAGTYAYQVRTPTAVVTGSITSIISPSVIEVDSVVNMEVGGMLVIGLSGDLSQDYLVKAINPSEDFTAELTLVEYAPAVFTADTEAIPAYDPQLGSGVLDAIVEVANLTSAERITYNNDGTANVFIDLSWDENKNIFNSDIFLSVNDDDVLQIDTTDEYSYTYEVEEDALGLEHIFYVDARNALGSHSGQLYSPSTTITPDGDITPPDDVENFRMSVISETIQLEWDDLIDPSLNRYEIRYNPSTAPSVLWNNSQTLISRVPKNSTSASVSSRVGTYLIKAVDGSGNYSENVGRAITTIPSLTSLNVIDTRNDATAWNGSKNNLEVVDSKLSLQLEGGGLYFESGWYEYENLLDTGQIYTSRISNKIQINGRSQDDLMVNWTTLAEVDAMQTWEDGDYSVKAYVRYASSLSSMADWTTLASVETLAQSSDFTDWREFTVGDYTGRYFQFALELISNTRVVTPVIIDGLIEIDMPDRIVSDDNIVTDAGGTRVDYTPKFIVKPALQISQDFVTSGDIYEITNHDRSGFDIIFKNGGSGVSRQFDYVAKGYGAEANEVI